MNLPSWLLSRLLILIAAKRRPRRQTAGPSVKGNRKLCGSPGKDVSNSSSGPRAKVLEVCHWKLFKYSKVGEIRGMTVTDSQSQVSYCQIWNLPLGLMNLLIFLLSHV